MIILKDTEKAFNKNPISLQIKSLSKLGERRKCLQLDKANLELIYLIKEDRVFSPRTSIAHCTRGSSQYSKSVRTKGTHTGKEAVRLPSATDGMMPVQKV